MSRMTTHTLAVAAMLAAVWLVAAHAAATPRPEDARVYIIAPTDGAVVRSPITVLFGLDGMGVAPAGIELPNTGHHHLLIDLPLGEVDLDAPLPADDQHRHFGGGQTQTTLELPPGEHTLQLLLADHQHVAHQPPLASVPITITVTE